LRHLRAIVRYLDISDGNLEEGSFRCDANVSIMPENSDTFGTRTELKNLNSFKHVEKAIQYEIERQKEILLDGGQVVQETRLWDPDKGRTFSMRGKEDAHDYRYFPDPDLLPLVVDETWVDRIQQELPELPDVRKTRFMADYQLSEYDAEILTAARELADFFEDCLTAFPKAKAVSNWVTGPLLALLHAEGKTIAESPVSPAHLAELLTLIENGTISSKIAKTVFDDMAQSGKSPKAIVEAKGLVQVTDPSAIEKVVDEILAQNPEEVAAYQNGKTKLMGFFVGQVMKQTRGKANPKIVNELLKTKLI
jgi:aspartyl-tRNA(Asn)/glutamyl-tRNA(Gln) amidotransferase subunit B